MAAEKKKPGKGNNDGKKKAGEGDNNGRNNGGNQNSQSGVQKIRRRTQARNLMRWTGRQFLKIDAC